MAETGIPESNHMLETLRVLSAHNVRFVVGGGVALVLYGHERMTMDLDIALDLEEDNLARFARAVKELDMRPSAQEPLSSLGDARRIAELVEQKNARVFPLVDPDQPYRQIDVFLTPDASYDALAKDCQFVQFPGFRVRVVSRRRLLEMKRSLEQPADKDKWDIQFLEKSLKSDEKAG